MDTKQKSLLILTVAALGFLGYQIFQLVDRDITESPVIVESTATPIAAVPSTPVTAPKPQMTLQTQPQPQASADTLNQSQSTYVQMLNQFELVKLHRQLLDEETAVATAQNQIAQLHSQTAKITGSNPDDGSNASAPVLNYIDQQNGQWSATLHINGVYQSIAPGVILSNGYQVMAISHQGVLLQKGQQRELLTFDGITDLPALSVPKPIVKVIAKPVVVIVAKPAVATTYVVKKITAPVLAVAPRPVVAAVAKPAVVAATPAVAKKLALLNSKPLQTQVAKSLIAIDPPKAKPVAPIIQLSIHDNYAQEDELHLPSVEIQPIVNQQAYNVGSYLPQQASIPQTYQLDSQASASTNGDQYAAESSDDNTAHVVIPAAVAHTNSVVPSYHHAKFLALPHNYYTIQLIGSSDAELIHRYVHANKLEHIAIQLPLHNDKRPWMIAVYGVYASDAAARAACAVLPKPLRANGAWVRRIGDIQKDLS